MEIVKPSQGRAATGRARTGAPDVSEPRTGSQSRLLGWLTSWRSSTTDRAQDKDPTLWMHRDVTA